VAVTFPAVQKAGSLNVVAIGSVDTVRSVVSVTDTQGNVYTQAVAPAVNTAGGISHTIYYAKDIVAAAAGGNTVTVTFDGPAVYPDVRIVEYAGLDHIVPVDVAATNVGDSDTSGVSLTTTVPEALLFSANTVGTLTAAPGAGFTSRVITSPNGGIAQDRSVTAAGTYDAAAPLAPGAPWVMQMVAFRVAGSPPPTADLTPPTAPATITAIRGVPGDIVVNWAMSTDNVGVTGYHLEYCQSLNCANWVQPHLRRCNGLDAGGGGGCGVHVADHDAGRADRGGPDGDRCGHL
jgi:hypothetical protein